MTIQIVRTEGDMIVPRGLALSSAANPAMAGDAEKGWDNMKQVSIGGPCR
jgi:hypothetical protein